MSHHTKRRALGVIRLSELTDETSSPVRERRDIEAKARLRNVDIIGWAERPRRVGVQDPAAEQAEAAQVVRPVSAN